MLKGKLSLLFVFVFILFSCRTEKSEIQEIAEIKSDAKVTFAFEREIELSHILFPHVVINGDRILIFGYDIRNKKNKMIEVYDLNLNIISSHILPYGLGPGDLTDASFLFFNNNLLYTFDNVARRFSIFDLADRVKFIESKRMREMAMPRISENFEFIAFFDMEWSENATRCKSILYCAKFPSLERLSKLDEIPSNKLESINLKFILGNCAYLDYFFKNNNIFILDMTRYILSKIDLSTRIATKRSVKFTPIKFHATVAEQERIIKMLEGKKANLNMLTLSETIIPTSWMIPLGKGFAVIRRHNFEQEKDGEVEADYFDYDLNMIGKIKMPYFFRFNTFIYPDYSYRTSYSANYLFTIEDTDENWILKKWYVDESEIKVPGMRR